MGVEVEQKIIENHKVLANRLKRMKRKLKSKERRSIDLDVLKSELNRCERMKRAVWSGSSWDYVDDGGASAEREERELEGKIELLERLIGKVEKNRI